MKEEKRKAIQFTLDSKIFIRSLSDAYVCTRQIAQLNVDKAKYFFNVTVLHESLFKKELLLAKYCTHDICNVNVIASKNKLSYEIFFMVKFSINLFLKYYNGIKDKKDYYELSKELVKIQHDLKQDLNNYVGYIKRRNEIVTKI
jgi:hypothetical protein